MIRRQETEAQEGSEMQIAETLLHQAEMIQVTSADTERMKRSVHRIIEKETGMRKWSVRKIIVVAATVCVLGSITAVAAGKITHSSGHGSLLDQFTYDKLGEMEAKLGFVTKAPGSFSNGYVFDTGVPIHNEGMDDDGNVVASGEELSLCYKKDGMPDITVMVEKTVMYDEEQPDQTFDHNGTVIGFTSDQYRFVPPDYQISEEEQARVDAGELYLSYGSREVEDQVIQGVSWMDKEIRYYMLTSDNSITAQEMAQMAGEIIDNQ